LVSLIVTCVDLALDLLCALTLVVGPIEAFVMVTAIDLSDFGIQGRRSLVIGGLFTGQLVEVQCDDS